MEHRGKCHQCRHYYVSWNPSYPHGCRAFQMVTRALPSLAVIRESGSPCLYEEPKAHPPKDGESVSPGTGDDGVWTA